jgi:hypothetical protein
MALGGKQKMHQAMPGEQSKDRLKYLKKGALARQANE